MKLPSEVRIQERAAARLDEIYRYSRAQWGQERAERYLETLFASFDRLAHSVQVSRPVPAEFGVSGFYYRCERHFVYWKRLGPNTIGIVTVLHERMHQIRRFHDDFET
ncbi:MAG: type II toxin-antitoxin system RelE/ParE family toxin [Wenzhouxiangellaceae bacterium]|nr:type II toxin-antitoxin system RelE/ParE family toxin [Wenzhouxiangellaceae bacterium]